MTTGLSLTQERKLKAYMLEKIAAYLQQDELEPFSVFARRYGFSNGFDLPACTRLLEKNFPPLKIDNDKVINPNNRGKK